MSKKPRTGQKPKGDAHPTVAMNVNHRPADDADLVEDRRGLKGPAGERPRGDADTNWDDATDSAEAYPGYEPNTPNSEVEALGRAAGLTYNDDEPLNYNKIDARDEKRWELNPASARDEDEIVPGDEAIDVDDADRDELDEIVDEDDLDEDEAG